MNELDPKTSRRLAKLLENLPIDDRIEYGKYVRKGKSGTLWLLRYELKQRNGNIKLKDK